MTLIYTDCTDLFLSIIRRFIGNIITNDFIMINLFFPFFIGTAKGPFAIFLYEPNLLIQVDAI